MSFSYRGCPAHTEDVLLIQKMFCSYRSCRADTEAVLLIQKLSCFFRSYPSHSEAVLLIKSCRADTEAVLLIQKLSCSYRSCPAYAGAEAFPAHVEAFPAHTFRHAQTETSCSHIVQAFPLIRKEKAYLLLLRLHRSGIGLLCHARY
jgi:hypothetical protein